MTPPTSAQVRDAADKQRLIPFLRSVVTATTKPPNPRCLYVAYIDARAVAQILDDSIGPEAWSFSLLHPPEWREKSWLAHGQLTVRVDGEEVHREDVGTNDDASGQTGAKGAASDALKRCAAQLGVGRALNYLPQVWEAGKAKNNGKIEADPEAAKRAIERWVAILDHKPAGEVPPVASDNGGPPVDPEAAETDPEARDPGEAPTDAQADELAELCSALRESDGQDWVAKSEAWLGEIHGVQTPTRQQLEELLGVLRAKRDELAGAGA